MVIEEFTYNGKLKITKIAKMSKLTRITIRNVF